MRIITKDYTVGALAKYFGITTDTIRLYDAKGILPSKKSTENGYRIFTRADCITMDYIRKLRLMDVSLEDIKMILNDYDIDQIQAFAEEQIECVDKEIQRLERVKVLQHWYLDLIKRAQQNVGKLEVRKSPVFILKDPGEESVTDTLFQFEDLGLDSLPLPGTYFKEALIGEYMGEVKKSIERGEPRIFFTQEDTKGITKKADFPRKEFEIIEPKLCIYTVLKCSSKAGYDDHDWIIEFAESEGLELIGSNLHRLIMTEKNNSTAIDYFELWYPVRKKQ